VTPLVLLVFFQDQSSLTPLVFWFFTFVFILLIAKNNKVMLFTDDHILLALIYMMLVPYLFRFIWKYLDSRGKAPSLFLSEIHNNMTAVRYPALYFAALLSIFLLFENYMVIFESSGALILSMSIVGILVVVFFVSYLIIRLFRVYIVVTHEFKNQNYKDREYQLYFLGINQEVIALFLSVLLSIVIVFEIEYGLNYFNISASTKVNAMFLLPFLTLIFPIITFILYHDWRAVRDFLTT